MTRKVVVSSQGNEKRVIGNPGPFQVIDSFTPQSPVSSSPPLPESFHPSLNEAEGTADSAAGNNDSSSGQVIVLNPPHRRGAPPPQLRVIDQPMDPPRRRYSCENYATCLDLAAALNWDNFTCRGCSGEVNENLLWRARQEVKRDEVAKKVCHDLPGIRVAKAGAGEGTKRKQAVR